jgi:hypothetical protein
MANPNQPDFSTPGPRQLPRLAQSMAYTMPSTNGAYNNPTTYRLSRGFPMLRRGVRVTPIPKFKGLTIYSHTPPAGNTGNPSNRAAVPTPFQNTKATTNSHTYTWPIGPA